MTESTTMLRGLDELEARARLQRFGPNALMERQRRGFARIVRETMREPMFALLLAAAAVYLAIGDLAEGLLLAAFALATVGLVILQERRSARALDALRSLAAPRVRVLRGGAVASIPASELVPGDVFLIGEGERVAADAVLREGASVAVDESLLTGESVPVRKLRSLEPVNDFDAARAGGDDAPWLFASTLVVGGHGLAEVLATGARTRVGRIGHSLATIEMPDTPLQTHLKKLVRVLGVLAIALSLLLVGWYGWVRGDWLQGVLSGIAMGMSMLPEEFPMALAVFLALGAWRMAGEKVLARRPAVIEALGAATVLCVDKTGTLTENRMRVRRLVTLQENVDVATQAPLPESVHRILEYAMLSSHRAGVEPMERAILSQGDVALAGTEHLHPGWLLEREYPLTPQLLAMSQAWTGEDGLRRIAAKGAPEAVVALCHLEAEPAAAWLRRAEALAASGLRVIAVAEGASPGVEAPDDQHDYDFALLGFVAFEDPVRPTVPAAVAQAREAGIAVAMITGDHPATALAIATQAGLDTEAGVLTGEELDAMDDAALGAAVARTRVYARVTPQQKLRLVLALQARGEVVAMTGDGVNDAPALKAAHIGIAMGERGTDVAREAASLVLLDEDFGRIVAAVRMGRRIFDNLRKVMTYITAIHVPIAGLALLPVLAGWPPLLLPAHVVLTEMIVDPVCSLAFEGAPEHPGAMRRPPRRSDDSLVGRPMLWRGLLQGAAVLAACVAIYLWALRSGRSADEARTLAVVSLTTGNLGLVWLNASLGVGWAAIFGRGFGAFWGVAALACSAIAAAIWLPGPRALLQFAPPDAAALAASVLAPVAAVIVLAVWLRTPAR